MRAVHAGWCQSRQERGEEKQHNWFMLYIDMYIMNLDDNHTVLFSHFSVDRLCSPQASDIILDPMCGTGAIPLEVSHIYTYTTILL